MKTILFIGAGPAQTTGIQIAKSLGHRVLAIDGDPTAPGLKVADLCEVIDIKDLSKLVTFAKKCKIDGALTIASDICLRAVGAINDSMGLPGLTKEQVVLATHKGLMREKFVAAGIPGPKFFIIQNEKQLLIAADEVGFPAVIKPVDNAGSRGVKFIQSYQELKKEYPETVKSSFSGEVILESFMPGAEVSVEAFIAQGNVHILTLSDKERTEPPFLLDTAVKFPSELSPDIRSKTVDTAINAIKALKLDDCPIHMELIITSEGPKVVEMAARGPGFKVYTDIIPHVTGVNCVSAQIDRLFNKEIDITPKEPLRGACILFFGSEKDGQIKKIQNLGQYEKWENVYELKIYVKPGDRVRKLASGSDRIGHIITLADTRDEALKIAKDIKKNINITTN